MREWRFYVPRGVIGALIAAIALVASAAVAGGAAVHHRPQYLYSVNHTPGSQGAAVITPQVAKARAFSAPARAKSPGGRHATRRSG